MLCYVELCYVALCCVVLCCVVLCCVVLSRVVLHRIVLCCIMVICLVLCFVVSTNAGLRIAKHLRRSPNDKPTLVNVPCFWASPGHLYLNLWPRPSIKPTLDKRLVHMPRSTRINPANTRHSPDAVSMLDQRRRRWASIETALGECLVLAGNCHPPSRQLQQPQNLSQYCCTYREESYCLSRLYKAE